MWLQNLENSVREISFNSLSIFSNQYQQELVTTRPIWYIYLKWQQGEAVAIIKALNIRRAFIYRNWALLVLACLNRVIHQSCPTVRYETNIYHTHTIRKQQFHSRELATRTGTSLVFSIMIRLGYRATQPKTANKVKPRVLLLMCFLSLAAIGQSKGSQWPLNTSTPRLEIESDWWITGECKVTSQVVCFPSFEIALMTILVEVTSKH